MPPTMHCVKENYATYELRYDVLSCIIDVIEANKVARLIIILLVNNLLY
jgi:hypothetical protein